jgi:hypothetical protein
MLVCDCCFRGWHMHCFITICEGFNKQLVVFMMHQIDMFYHFVLDLGHGHVIDWDNE